MSDPYVPTLKLRWLETSTAIKLQQWWGTPVERHEPVLAGIPIFVAKGEWRDVPLETE